MENHKSNKVRIIAFYLPQYHPIKENDIWWGKGFTEWTNVGKAKPLFKGHYQPRIPADLGYYDLRLSETREAQAELARNAGIEGFAYWHYWWGGKQLLERPFNEVLKTGKPNYPFCLSWANEDWTSIWNGNAKKILVKQTYPGKEDYEKHFHAIVEAFHDKRYIRIDEKPVFIIYKPFKIPNVEKYLSLWRGLAIKNGLKGIHFIGIVERPEYEIEQLLNLGFDAVNTNRTYDARTKLEGKLRHSLKMRIAKDVGGIFLNKYEYKDIIKYLFAETDQLEKVYPSILPQWDNSPRSGRRAIIYHNSSPQLFKQHLINALNIIKHKSNKILFLKSWNEWAEGNYVEPDLKYGDGYLKAISEIFYK